MDSSTKQVKMDTMYYAVSPSTYWDSQIAASWVPEDSDLGLTEMLYTARGS